MVPCSSSVRRRIATIRSAAATVKRRQQHGIASLLLLNNDNYGNNSQLRTTTTCFISTSTSTTMPSLHQCNSSSLQHRTFHSSIPVLQKQQKKDESADGESLQETIERLKHTKDDGSKDGGETSKKSTAKKDGSGVDSGDVVRKVVSIWDTFRAEVSDTWKELIESGQSKSINKKIHPTETEGGDAPYTGPVEIMVIDPSEQLTAWGRMQKRLTDAPIIQDILTKSEHIYETSGAKAAQEKMTHIKEDAAEAWETSQNPWVYRVSSVYDTVTAESMESIAVKELRILDPTFTLEGWRADVVAHTLPNIMDWFLSGRINQLKPWLGEGVFTRMAAEMKAREAEGTQIDTNVLGIMNSEILAIELDEVNKGAPIILLHFMCQQINCVRNKKSGEVVEGAEDQIKANSYVCAFQREYNEERGELNWKIIDFRFNGAIAYL